MYLPLTSIQDAWGVSTLEDRSDTAILTNRFHGEGRNHLPGNNNNGFLEQQQSNSSTHPNAIQEPIQGRMDIPVFDRAVIESMKNQPQQDRTHLVTKLLRTYFTSLTATKPTTTVTNRSHIPTTYASPKPKKTSVEYYKSSSSVTDNGENAEKLLSIMTLMLLFILADKLFVIWNKS